MRRLPILLLAGGLVASLPAMADDRRLFEGRSGKPYVFLLADTSAAMTLGPEDEWVPAGQDDPGSRSYMARQAIHEFLAGAGESIALGWARLDLPDLQVVSKHRVYTPAEDPSWLHLPPFAGGGSGPPWNGAGVPGVAYPRRGHPLVFGDASAHDGDDPAEQPGDDTDGSCLLPENLDEGSDGEGTVLVGWTDNPALARLWTFAKLGAQGDHTTTQWMRFAGVSYRLTWSPVETGAAAGDWPRDLEVDVLLERSLGACAEERFELVGGERLRLVPLYSTDPTGRPLAGPTEAILGAGSPPWTYDGADIQHGPVCSGPGFWDGNRDDLESPYSYDTLRDPLGRDGVLETFDRGDRIPLDWERGVFLTENAVALMGRLAPNTTLGAPVPDFRVAPYLKDPVSGAPDGPLPPVDELTGRSPLIFGGERAVGGALEAFSRWHESWQRIAGDVETGDPQVACRRLHLVLVLSGGEQCAGSGGPVAAVLRERGVEVSVVLLAIAPDAGTLAELDELASSGTCADRNGDGGGADCTWTAASSDELVGALERIVAAGSAPGGVVSGASLPPVSADLGERIFLTGFVPADGAIHPGRIHAFARPLPLDAAGLPDVDLECSEERRAACHLWDAQRTVGREQFDPREPVGPGRGQRQVFYSELGDGRAIPQERSLLVPLDTSTPSGRRHDFWRGLDIDFIAGDLLSEQRAESAANGVIRMVLAMKRARGADGRLHEYLLGDVFHSNPLIVGAPRNLGFLGGAGEGDCDYGCFALRHRFRRQVLLVGSNDGMLHAFDAGVFRRAPAAGGGAFDTGTGRELFAYVPRPVLPTLRRMMSEQPPRHRYTVDGGLVAADVFIDPAHSGPDSAAPPAGGDRAWRTVLIGGLRRGGERSADRLEPVSAPPGPRQSASGYFALDLTQPDLNELHDVDGDGRPESVPAVAEGQAIPACLAAGGGPAPPDCGPIPWASPLWEFTDSAPSSGGIGLVSLDEDGNGLADLAFTWSRPGIGRIRVCAGGDCGPDDLEDRHVAVFGGGIDPAHPQSRGDWLYMVDIETGRAIFKKKLLGAAPSEPATVDLDFDGYIDRVYVGTTLGLLYRLDLWLEADDGRRRYPRLESVEVGDGRSPRIVEEGFAPRVLFEANDGTLDSVLAGTSRPRPIFFPPAVLFAGELDGFVLALGTGDREDLFSTGWPTGRFFVFLDEVRSSDLQEVDFEPLRAAGLEGLLPGHTGDGDLLGARVPGKQGWYLDLAPDERLAAQPLGVAGVISFSTWNPAAALERAGGNECLGSGAGRVFAVETTTGGSLIFDPAGEERPYLSVDRLAGNAFVEPARTRVQSSPGQPAPDLTPALERAREALRARLPDDCRFAPGVRMDLKLTLADGRLVEVVPIPVCIRQRDYREP